MASEGKTRHRTHGELSARAEHSGSAYLLLPAQRWVQHLVTAGIAMLAGAVIALLWVNLPIGWTYDEVWRSPVRVAVWRVVLREDLHGLVVDGLMAIFFLLATLEVKREVVVGELAEWKRAAFPLAVAAGGIVVPAAVFVAVNLLLPDGQPSAWGIPVATDIAFSLAVLAFVGGAGRIRTLLLSMAVADDIAGILIIAVVYAGNISFSGLLLAGLLVLLAWAMVRAGIGAATLYVGVGVALWLVLHASGVHPTIAGVALALVIPVRPTRTPRAAVDDIRDTVDRVDFRDEPPGAEEPDEKAGEKRQRAARIESQVALGRITAVAASSESAGDRISRMLMPWTRFLILPLFALAAAGVRVPIDRIGDVVTDPVGLGVFLGLAVGKPIGILGAAWLVRSTGVGRPPSGMTWAELTGVGLLAGIGFTVSLFITGLAIEQPEASQAATLGVLAGSLVSAVAAIAWLRLAARRA